MSLVTRVSVSFLVTLGLALGGFSASLYYLASLRLRLALDQELEATLDRFPDRDRSEGQSGRVTWAIYDEAGRRVEATPGDGRSMVATSARWRWTWRPRSKDPRDCAGESSLGNRRRTASPRAA